MNNDKNDFSIKVLFNEDGSNFQEVLEKIIFERIKNNLEETNLLK